MFLILFDFDGTLVDSQHSIVAAMQDAFGSHNLPSPSREDVLSVVGLSLDQAVWYLHREANVNLIKSLVAAYKDAYTVNRKRSAYEEPLYAGARETLNSLYKRDDVFLGIATGKSRKGLLRVLDEHDLRGHFQTLQTADDARSKPHPEMIERALRDTGIEKSRTVMIGDTSFDMEMGKIAKVTPIGVSWGYHDVNRLKKTGAKHVVDNFSELQSILTSFCEQREAV